MLQGDLTSYFQLIQVFLISHILNLLIGHFKLKIYTVILILPDYRDNFFAVLPKSTHWWVKNN